VNDEQLLRYGRHILLPEIGIEGQQRLLAARVLIVGAGGLGSPAAMYCAASGIGRLTIADNDTVELSNLQRQLLHGSEDLGRPKADSAKETLARLNPDIEIDTIAQSLEGDLLQTAVSETDVVIDGSDNFATRFAVNAACVAHRRPLVSGAVIRWTGQIGVFRADLGGGPCYRCLYHEEGESNQPCAETGVFAPLAGIIGSMQAAEALKIVLGEQASLAGQLLRLDARTMTWKQARIERDPGCPVCGGQDRWQ